MLADKAMLIHLSISVWQGRKQDKNATRTVEETFKTERGATNTTKNLMPKASELDQIKAIAAQIRAFVKDNSLPWETSGARIIKSNSFMDFQREYKTLKQSFDDAVESFLQAYPSLKTAARLSLDGLYNEMEYPSQGELAGLFNCSLIVRPLAADFRTEVDADIRAEYDKAQRDNEARVLREVWDRLHAVVKNAADTLKQPDAIFRDSLINNIAELCQLMPRLNVLDDAALETARREVEAFVAGISPDVCRDNASERANTAKALDELTQKMGAFMGAVGA